MSFPSYRDFIIAHGYSPADPNIIDRGGDSIWRISSKNNLCRFSDDDNVRVTVCRSRHNQIGYMWNIGNDSGWVGPFDCFDDAMDHADMNVFD